MSTQDRKWLEEAMKAYTFNDVDKLSEVCAELKKHQEGELKSDAGYILDLLD